MTGRWSLLESTRGSLWRARDCLERTRVPKSRRVDERPRRGGTARAVTGRIRLGAAGRFERADPVTGDVQTRRGELASRFGRTLHFLAECGCLITWRRVGTLANEWGKEKGGGKGDRPKGSVKSHLSTHVGE